MVNPTWISLLLNLETHSFRTIEVCDDPACKRK
jgi:hypothetical protein